MEFSLASATPYVHQSDVDTALVWNNPSGPFILAAELQLQR